jgi:pimeloyl-ACP methyl ester carboxylesterase
MAGIRIRIPVLMINGRNDFDIPVKELQEPLFRWLGSPPGDKKHVVVEGGHVVPRHPAAKQPAFAPERAPSCGLFLRSPGR